MNDTSLSPAALEIMRLLAEKPDDHVIVKCGVCGHLGHLHFDYCGMHCNQPLVRVL